MSLEEIIGNSSNINDDLVVFAKRIDGRFLSVSEAVLLDLTEEEHNMKIDQIADNKCPGFDYFLEVFLIKEMMEDFNESDPEKNIEQKIEIVIHYAEFDA